MILLTHSSTTAYRACPRRYYYRYELGLRPDRISAPLRMGSAVHLGLDARAQGRSPEDSLLVAAEAYSTYPAWAVTDDARREWEYERETVIRLLHAYFWYWQAPDAQITFLDTEKVFSLPIRNPVTGAIAKIFKFAGKMDKRVRLFDGRVALYEHKTTSLSLAPDSEYWNNLRLDPQVSAYLAAARRLNMGVSTVMYDVLRKPQIEPTPVPLLDDQGFKVVLDRDGRRVLTKAGKPRETGSTAEGFVLQTRPMTSAEWGDKLTADIVSRPDHYFARREIARLDADLEEWEEELWQQQQQLLESRRRGRWFKSVSWANCGHCEFRDVCQTNIRPLGPTDVPDGFVKVGPAEVHAELMEVPPADGTLKTNLTDRACSVAAQAQVDV